MAERVVDVGGVHTFALGEEVYWPASGARAKVIALTVEPSVTIEFDTGARITVGQSTLRVVSRPIPETHNSGREGNR